MLSSMYLVQVEVVMKSNRFCKLVIQPLGPLEPVPRFRAVWYSKFPEIQYGSVFNLLIFKSEAKRS